MVHTFSKKPIIGKTYRNIDVVRDVIANETKADRDFINNKFHKLPANIQYLLTQPSGELNAPPFRKIKEAIKLTPVGDEKVQNRRYGVFAIHDRKIYVGYVVPEGKNKAEVKLKEVFP